MVFKTGAPLDFRTYTVELTAWTEELLARPKSPLEGKRVLVDHSSLLFEVSR